MKVVTAAQMAAIERASERVGVSTDTLMENAGLAVARAARDELGGAAGARIVVLVGPGNNGADGLVAARHLRRWGAEVVCCLLTGRPEVDPKLDLAVEYGVEIVSEPGSDALDRVLRRSRLVIDSVLGTGRSRPLAGPVGEAMRRLQRVRQSVRRPVLMALDLPTGLNADTGAVDPDLPAVRRDSGPWLSQGGVVAVSRAERAGRLRVLDIGVPVGLQEERSVDVEVMTPQGVRDRLLPRPLDSHKGTYGHSLVVAGSRQYVGAAWLASQASVRTGAGLTTLATPESVYALAAAKGAEAIHLPLVEDGEGRIAATAGGVIGRSDRRFTAALAGCGMGWSEGTTEFLRGFLQLTQSKLAGQPLLIDADGLNNLSVIRDWRGRINGPVVLTPHPGEMSTLTGIPVAHIQADRWSVAREWSKRWGATLVLKGAYTVIASPGEPLQISPFANPGLATGGTGDVLSGVVVSLLAQGLHPADAAVVGVWLHGAAGEAVTGRMGEAGLAASDLLDALPPAMAELRRATLS